MGRHNLTFLFLLSVVSTFGQGTPKDTLDKKPVSRPHILYFEGMGRAAYYNFGYGYAFFQREKHELNATIGFCHINGDARSELTFIPIGLFYRFGTRWKFEGGFSVTSRINWQRFRGRYYDTGEGYREETVRHGAGLFPSIGFVWATRNQLFEIGARYTPLIDPTRLENSVPYIFSAFFQSRLKGKKKEKKQLTPTRVTDATPFRVKG